jgi:hypothetical protein
MIDQQPTVVSLTDAAVVKLQELTKEDTKIGRASCRERV